MIEKIPYQEENLRSWVHWTLVDNSFEGDKYIARAVQAVLSELDELREEIRVNENGYMQVRGQLESENEVLCSEVDALRECRYRLKSELETANNLLDEQQKQIEEVCARHLAAVDEVFKLEREIEKENEYQSRKLANTLNVLDLTEKECARLMDRNRELQHTVNYFSK